jgi:pectate lyase
MRATQFSGADRWFGLIGRYVDASNYYYITVRSSNNISLRKLSNGVATTLDTATMPVALNTWYNLRLDIVGNKLRAYVDGRLVLEATDASAPHVAGRYGVGAYKTAAQADDFLAVQL